MAVVADACAAPAPSNPNPERPSPARDQTVLSTLVSATALEGATSERGARNEKKSTSSPSRYLPARPQAVGHLPPGCRRRLRSYRSWSHQASVRNERRTKVHHSSS